MDGSTGPINGHDMTDRDGLPSGIPSTSLAHQVAELERQLQLKTNCVKDRSGQIDTLRAKVAELEGRLQRERDQCDRLQSLMPDHASMIQRIHKIPRWVQRLFGAAS